MRLMLKRNQQGDTIVEVLFAIIVASAVLVGAYTAVTRNIAYMQDAQEHAEALQLIQAQLEFLRNTPAANVPVSPTSTRPCFIGSGSQEGKPALTAAQCTMDSSGNTAGAGTQPAFTIKITQPAGSPSGTNVYEVIATWQSGATKGTDTVSLFYGR